MMNRQGSKVRVEAALVPMDQGNGEEQARLWSMVYEGPVKL
jgi:TolB-like protein